MEWNNTEKPQEARLAKATAIPLSNLPVGNLKNSQKLQNYFLQNLKK